MRFLKHRFSLCEWKYTEVEVAGQWRHPQVLQALGTLGITITCAKLIGIILIDLFTEPTDIFKVLAHLQFA
jgi:hypothetical protein